MRLGRLGVLMMVVVQGLSWLRVPWWAFKWLLLAAAVTGLAWCTARLAAATPEPAASPGVWRLTCARGACVMPAGGRITVSAAVGAVDPAAGRLAWEWAVAMPPGAYRVVGSGRGGWSSTLVWEQWRPGRLSVRYRVRDRRGRVATAYRTVEVVASGPGA